MRTRSLAATLAASALLLSACSGDGTGPGAAGDRLTETELAELSRALLGFGASQAPTTSPARRNVAGSAADSYGFTFDTSVPCVPGGKVGVKGSIGATYDPATEAGEIQTDLTLTHQACAHQLESGVVTVTGDPSLRFTVLVRAAGEELTAYRVTETGAFTWSKGDGNSGRCTVNVTSELVTAQNVVRTTGSFCGWTVDETHPLES